MKNIRRQNFLIQELLRTKGDVMREWRIRQLIKREWQKVVKNDK